MSHFYRYTRAKDPEHKFGIQRVDCYRPSGKTGGLPTEWRRAMRQNEIPLDPPWPHCKMLRAPLMPEDYAQEYNMFQLAPGFEVPDLFSSANNLLVSERAKALLETLDDFGHEFIETEIQDKNRQRINTTPYYLFYLRRILMIDDLGGKVENWKEMFYPDGDEDHYLPTIQQTPEAKRHPPVFSPL